MGLGNVILHIVPAICPFLYMMFNFPSPKYWFLALDVDKAWAFNPSFSKPKQYFDRCLTVIKRPIFSPRPPWRMPFNTHTPLIFTISLVFEFCITLAFIINAVTFSAIFFSTCRYFQSIIEDLSMIIARTNTTIWETVVVKKNLKHFIWLNLQCYRCAQAFLHFPFDFAPKSLFALRFACESSKYFNFHWKIWEFTICSRKLEKIDETRDFPCCKSYFSVSFNPNPSANQNLPLQDSWNARKYYERIHILPNHHQWHPINRHSVQNRSRKPMQHGKPHFFLARRCFDLRKPVFSPIPRRAPRISRLTLRSTWTNWYSCYSKAMCCATSSAR